MVELQKRKVSYKLYPSKLQEILLLELLRGHQQLYNAALQERSEAWKKCGKSISYADQCKSLTEIRQSMPEWTVANCSSQQMTLRRLDKAFKAFFRRLKAGENPGYPRFKSLARYPGFSFKSHGDGWRFTPGQDWKHGILRIGGVGHIRCRGQARQGGKICASDLLFRNGTWYLSLTVELSHILRERTSSAAVGIDWGVESLLTLASEEGLHQVVENPRWYQSSKEEITRLQQAVSRKKRGSNRRKRAVRALAQARSLQARKRLDHLHQVSAKIARENALVAMEELSITNMTRSAKGTVEEPGKNVQQKAGLNREILDTAPTLLTQLIRYKVSETGGEFVDVPTKKAKPSQTCPACGQVEKKMLAQRIHECLCGHREPRDAASARVTLNWALFGKPIAPIRPGTGLGAA
ncbi:RNA-guided endonuclease InsQ/TnpB family protein [Pseudomonas aeruginosa]